MYVSAFSDTYTHIYIHIYIYTHININIYIYIYIHTGIHSIFPMVGASSPVSRMKRDVRKYVRTYKCTPFLYFPWSGVHRQCPAWREEGGSEREREREREKEKERARERERRV